MDIIYNELSFVPLAKNIHQVEENFSTLLEAFKAAKTKFGFKKIRFQKNLSEQLVTEELNFIQAISSFSNKDIQRAVITFLSPPYYDQLTEDEIDNYLESNYRVIDKNCPNKKEPFGLPIAHIKRVPTISLNTDSFWRNNLIKVEKYNLDPKAIFDVPNICISSDCNSDELITWKTNSLSEFITTKDELLLFIDFTKYKADISDDFFTQLLEWKNNNKIYNYILSLMKDVELHPFSGGMGRTENLRNRGKEASKRITNRYPDGDRLSYEIEGDIVKFIACKGHYRFH